MNQHALANLPTMQTQREWTLIPLLWTSRITQATLMHSSRHLRSIILLLYLRTRRKSREAKAKKIRQKRRKSYQGLSKLKLLCILERLEYLRKVTQSQSSLDKTLTSSTMNYHSIVLLIAPRREIMPLNNLEMIKKTNQRWKYATYQVTHGL